MKRTVQMATSGTPSRGQPSKAKGHRGVGKPKREWTPNGPIGGTRPNGRPRSVRGWRP